MLAAVSSGVAFHFLYCLTACAGEMDTWSAWRGPRGDGVSPIALEIPAAWPKKLTEVWSAPAKAGFSSPVTDGKRVYIQCREDKTEQLAALEFATGKEVWRVPLDKLAEPQPHDPAPTPTLFGGALYTQSMAGIVYRIDPASGKTVWRRDLPAEWKGETKFPMYGVSASPLVWDNLLWLPIGDREKGKVVALKLDNGSTAFEHDCAAPGYSSFVALKLGGAECLVTLLYNSVFALKKEGTSYVQAFTFELQGGTDGNSTTPAGMGENVVLLTSQNETLALRVLPGVQKTEELWRIKDGANLSSPIFVNDRVYIHLQSDLACLDKTTGKAISKISMDAQHCGMVAAGKLLMCRLHDGTVKFINIENAEMKLVASYEPPEEEGESWSTAIPVGARRVVMRLGGRLVCLEY